MSPQSNENGKWILRHVYCSSFFRLVGPIDSLLRNSTLVPSLNVPNIREVERSPLLLSMHSQQVMSLEPERAEPVSCPHRIS